MKYILINSSFPGSETQKNAVRVAMCEYAKIKNNEQYLSVVLFFMVCKVVLNTVDLS